MVIWREIWISLIICNFTPFNRIEMGFSKDIIEIYAENEDKFFTISSLNFYSNTKFGHHLWRHNRDEIKPIERSFINLLPCQVSSFDSFYSVLCLKLSVLRGAEGKALATDQRALTAIHGPRWLQITRSCTNLTFERIHKFIPPPW